MGIPDHLTCLSRNLCANQEATVRTGHGTTDWFQIGKGVHQGCILSPCLFNFYAKYITVIQVYAPASNAEVADVEWFYEDLQDLLELTPPKDVLLPFLSSFVSFLLKGIDSLEAQTQRIISLGIEYVNG